MLVLIDDVVGDFKSMYLRWNGVLALWVCLCYGVFGMHGRFNENYIYRTII